MTQEAGVPKGFWERVEQIAERAVAKYARSGALRNSSISEGGLTIKGGGGLILKDGGDFSVLYREEDGGGGAVYAGDLYSVVTGAYRGTGLSIFAPNGTAIAQFHTDNQFGVDSSIAEVFDSGQRVVVATDAASGQGLARPYVPGVFYRARNVDWPTVTDTSFQTVYRARMPKQHPRLLVKAWGANNTAGATGELRVLVNGTQFGATVTTVSGAVTEFIFGPAVVAGEHMAELAVEIQARLASGAGGVQVGASQCQGLQS